MSSRRVSLSGAPRDLPHIIEEDGSDEMSSSRSEKDATPHQVPVWDRSSRFSASSIRLEPLNEGMEVNVPRLRISFARLSSGRRGTGGTGGGGGGDRNGSDDDDDWDLGLMEDGAEGGEGGTSLSGSALERILIASRSFRGRSSSSGSATSSVTTGSTSSTGVRPSHQYARQSSMRRSSGMSSRSRSSGLSSRSRSNSSLSMGGTGMGERSLSSISLVSSDGMGGSVGALGSVGEFTSKVSRRSENVRRSIAKHSGGVVASLIRTIQGDGELSTSGGDGENRKNHPHNHRRYGIGDAVLIHNDNTRGANCVNRHGYPRGGGIILAEGQGPYAYVLGHVKTVHYEENAVYYTLTRVDNGTEIRGDMDNMEPIPTKAGEDAARQAASEFQGDLAFATEEQSEPDELSLDNHERGGGAFEVVEFILEVLLLPVFLLYHLFRASIGARLVRWAVALFSFLKRQAHAFLYGRSPYTCSMNITTINIIVLCSIWYMFIDQARLAFFPTSSDGRLALVNCVIWSLLTIELISAVFIRPDGYNALIKSEKAYLPTTARFISGMHLAAEAISLAFFVPEFVCLFHPDLKCDDRPTFSFSNATLFAITGRTRLEVLKGRFFYACIRLRIFGLVRLWRNRWLKRKFIKRERQTTYRSEKNWNLTLSPTDTLKDDDESVTSITRENQMRVERKQRNDALINASNIGTALMVTNSYRALAILVTIAGVLPMITLIGFEGVANSVTVDLVDQLQATNLIVTVESEEACEFLVDSVSSWVKAWSAKDHRHITTDTEDFLVGVVIRPARCQESFESLEAGMLSFKQMRCSDLEGQYNLNLGKNSYDDECILGGLDTDLRSVAKMLDVREGNLVLQGSGTAHDTLVTVNGTSTEASFEVTAYFNQTQTIENSALASCVVQLCLLLTVLGCLSVLRYDAEDLVLGPLRSMLKIVARYARNPLAQTGIDSGKVSRSGRSDTDTSDSSEGSDKEVTAGFGTYETEQLITAVSKITDLLRKCWGVAGADIISTNLASREGELAEVFNPTVPGKSVYALFAFAAINGFDHALKSLGGDVMILINDVARVLHDEVYRWGFGDSGQCNKNLGAAFLMVFRIGSVKEVVEKLEEATKVVFSSDSKKQLKKKNRGGPAQLRLDQSSRNPGGRQLPRTTTPLIKSNMSSVQEQHSIADAMQLSLQSLPGISMFTDRAVLGMLKSFAGIHRDNKLMGWGRDFRLSAGVNAFEVNMIFGMDAGWAVEGAVGSEYKIDATYLSPHVNMASRMMSACKHYGVTILLSEAVQELMSDPAKKKLRNVDRVTVKGSVRIQNIFTYDARHKGADFFLLGRSDTLADMDAEQYVPSIWTSDQDLQAMRHHITDDFEAEFNAGLKAYYAGDWPTAIRKLESANEIMVDAAMEEGYLHDELDNTPYRKELYRKETADGPCSYLVNFMKSKGGVAPEDWDGWHPLLSK